MNTAARSPADWEVDISLVKRYVANAVRPENPGASRTQMFRISTGIVRARNAW